MNNPDYYSGAADAAIGLSPTSTSPDYLRGYLEKLHQLILKDPQSLQIRWLSPAYRSSGYDSAPYYQQEED